MKTFLSLFVLLYMCGIINLQRSDIEETIYTKGHRINVMRDRGKSVRLEFRKTPFLKIGDLKNPPGTYPWEVSIGLVDPSRRGNWTHYCGGVIASKYHVITSANCLDFMVKSEYAGCSVTDIHIRAGDNHLKVENEMIRNVEIQEIKISNYTVHPEFNRTEYSEDIQHYKNIAVITLEESLNFEHISVRSIYMPSLEEAEQITKKSNTDISVVLAGWGNWTSKDGKKLSPGKALRDGIIATFDDAYCESVYNETRLSEGFTDDVMCGANPLNLAGVCCGDDGSGVVKLDHEKERFVLTGILSLGTKWNNEAEELSCGHKNKPNILVRVASKSIITFLYESIYGIPVFSNQTEEVSAGLLEMKVSQYAYEECGLNTAIEDDYNYGDETNKTGVWPWLVSLRKEVQDVNDYSYKWTHFCGGTILSPTRILTAAHCVYDFSGLDTVIKIRAGDALLNNNNDDEDIQQIVIQNFTVHLNYTHNLRYFDLAILELQNSLIFSKYVRPVCLLSLEEAISISKSAEEYLPMCVAGWGNKGDELKHTVATVFSEETCNRTHPNKLDYGNLVPNLFTEDTMCAGDPAGESGTCRGDSGSGAVHFEQHRQRYVQRAIVSGSAHGLCGSMYYPNVYVRLSNPDILQWIFDEIGFFPPKPVAVSDEKMVDSDTTLLCTTSPAMPASTITWIVRDQHENLVDHKKLSETLTKTDEGYITSSYVKITTSKAVSVQCKAKNVAGKQTNNSINELACSRSCDPRGSIFDVCTTKGECRCKDNVKGRNCDHCKEGAFHLSEKNPQGCSSCFCSGVTDKCSDGRLFWSTLMMPIYEENHGISLVDNVTRVIKQPEKLNFLRQSYELSYRVHPGDSTVYYWDLPQLFRGNKVTAYGGNMTITQRYKTSSRWGDKPIKAADIIMMGNGVTLVYNKATDWSSGINITYRIPMSEDGWMVKTSGGAATREDFLKATIDIEAILVRATLVENMVETVLKKVMMDIAVPEATGNPQAQGIEECRCPEGYKGFSCEECARGFYKDYSNRCIQCPCNNNELSCSRVGWNGDVQCTCKDGYTGNFCGNGDGCYEEDTNYYGNDINMNTGRNVDRKESPAECQELCTQTEGCKFFTWKQYSKECWSKTVGGYGKGHHEIGSVSGPRNCGDLDSARASSQLESSQHCWGGGAWCIWGPQFAIDGVIQTTYGKIFHSNEGDNYPWFEVELINSTKISSVTIYNRPDCCGERFKNAEIRAGMTRVPDGTIGQLLNINTICGTYSGPGANGEEIRIDCASPIMAKFITVQLKDINAILQINEIRINING